MRKPLSAAPGPAGWALAGETALVVEAGAAGCLPAQARCRVSVSSGARGAKAWAFMGVQIVARGRAKCRPGAVTGLLPTAGRGGRISGRRRLVMKDNNRTRLVVLA